MLRCRGGPCCCCCCCRRGPLVRAAQCMRALPEFQCASFSNACLLAWRLTRHTHRCARRCAAGAAGRARAFWCSGPTMQRQSGCTTLVPWTFSAALRWLRRWAGRGALLCPLPSAMLLPLASVSACCMRRGLAPNMLLHVISPLLLPPGGALVATQPERAGAAAADGGSGGGTAAAAAGHGRRAGAQLRHVGLESARLLCGRSRAIGWGWMAPLLGSKGPSSACVHALCGCSTWMDLESRLLAALPSPPARRWHLCRRKRRRPRQASQDLQALIHPPRLPQSQSPIQILKMTLRAMRRRPPARGQQQTPSGGGMRRRCSGQWRPRLCGGRSCSRQ